MCHLLIRSCFQHSEVICPWDVGSDEPETKIDLHLIQLAQKFRELRIDPDIANHASII